MLVCIKPIYSTSHSETVSLVSAIMFFIVRFSGFNNNNTHICIALYGGNFRGAVARDCASESEKREESKPERKGISLAQINML